MTNHTLNPRQSHIRAIHAMAGRLGHTDEVYRAVLLAQTGQRSSTVMSVAELRTVRNYYERACTAAGLHTSQTAKPRPVPAVECRQLCKKVRGMLIELGRKPNSYADTIAKTMHNKTYFEQCDVAELQAICLALGRQLARAKAALQHP